MSSPQYGQILNSGINDFPHVGHTIGKYSFSSSFLISFFKVPISAFIFSMLSFSEGIPLTSVRMLYIMSLTFASIWLFDSIVLLITSRISPFSSRSCASTAVWVLASESILFRKASTGLVKAIMHVTPHRMNDAAALIQKYVIGVMVCSL